MACWLKGRPRCSVPSSVSSDSSSAHVSLSDLWRISCSGGIMNWLIQHTQKTRLDSLCSIPAVAGSLIAQKCQSPACEHQPCGGALRDQMLFWRRGEKGRTVTEAAWRFYGYRVQSRSVHEAAVGWLGCGKLSNDLRRSSRGVGPDAMPITPVHVAGFSLPANQSGRD